MNLLNLYLKEVASYLPAEQRRDIIAELRANLLSQMAEKGSPLSEAEQIEILQNHGNPAIVAGRYRDPNSGFVFGRTLIGAELFPIYKAIVLITFTGTIGIFFILLPLLGRQVELVDAFLPLAIQFAMITLIFILLEWGKDHQLNKWNPNA